MKLEKARFLSDLSTFGIGGPARELATVDSLEALQEALQYAKQEELPFIVIGKGSNCLFDDRGFDGLVILNKISTLEEQDDGAFCVGAGYSFARLGMHTARHGWEGLEFAAGIPGSVGGAVYMNAGACGGETADCLQSVDYLHANGELHHYPCQELSFAYRSSPFQKMSGAIVRATFQLCPAEAVRERQRQQIDYRTTTQPYGEKSAGCMFRNPKGDSAGALIEAAKLKGLSCGDAQVSEKHANFIVNKGEARSSDVLALIDEVRKQVESKTGKSLESEVHYVPYHPKELS